jgi:hypothetical protein
MLMDKDYHITETDVRYREKDVVATVVIDTGEFAGVEYHYGAIHVNEEENPDGTLTMGFDYEIISEENKHLQGNEAFESTLGVILNNILLKSLEAAERKYKDEIGTKNPQAPNL